MCRKVKKLFKFIGEPLRASTGNAMMAVMIAGAAVGGGALLVSKSGQQRGDMYADINQNTLIEYTMLDLKTHMALEKNCKAALDTGFATIGSYSEGDDLGAGVSIEQIKDLNPGERVRTISITFKKDKAMGSKQKSSRRPDTFKIQTFNAPDPADPSGATQILTCSAYEVAGVDGGMKGFCETIGGAYDELDGSCTPNFADDSAFRQDMQRLSCEALGGVYNGGACDKVEINGNILASHFQLNNVNLSATNRTGSINSQCADSEIGKKLNVDGSLSCSSISCPKPSTSNYDPRVVSGQLYCECQRDRGSDLACGQIDQNSCEDYLVDDGCGTGAKCVIKRKTKICPDMPSCDPDTDQVIYSEEGCNFYCGTVPKCPANNNTGNNNNNGGGTCSEGHEKPDPSSNATVCCARRDGQTCAVEGRGFFTCINGEYVHGCDREQ